MYCNWLSTKEGYESAYEIKGSVQRNTKKTPDVIWYVDRNGYRLPTPEEWQNAIYSNHTNASEVLNELEIEDEASNSTDGFRDSKGRSRFIIFSCYTVYRNQLGLYINLSQNINEFVWGFGFKDEGLITRQESRREQALELADNLSSTCVLLFFKKSIDTFEPNKVNYNATFRVVRNGDVN